MKFLAKMPRSNPKAGTIYMVVSVKDEHGNRMELSGDFEEAKVKRAWKTALAAVVKKAKP